MNEPYRVREPVHTLPVDRANEWLESGPAQLLELDVALCADHAVAEGAELHRGNSGLGGGGDSPVAERAVQAEPMQLLAITSHTRNAIDVQQHVGAGMHGVGECDGLLRRLIKSEYRKRETEPGRDDEDGDGDKDAGDGQPAGRDDRDQYLYPRWDSTFACVGRVSLRCAQSSFVFSARTPEPVRPKLLPKPAPEYDFEIVEEIDHEHDVNCNPHDRGEPQRVKERAQLAQAWRNGARCYCRWKDRVGGDERPAADYRKEERQPEKFEGVTPVSPLVSGQWDDFHPLVGPP